MTPRRAGRWGPGARLLAALAALAALLVASLPARAQPAAPQISVSASQPQAEVGEPFTIELQAMSDGGGPIAGDPSLSAPPVFSVQGPQVSTQQQMSIINGRTTSRAGIHATWTLTAAKTGRYTIPAPTVRWNGSRLAGSPVTIEIVPATGKPRVRGRGSLMPGGPFGGFPWPFGQPQIADDGDSLDDSAQDAAGLSMPTAPDPEIFLRAVADKREAVVGEQVTLSLYIYQRTSVELSERHDPDLADFVRVPLLKNPGAEPPVTAVAGGNRYLVRLIDKLAIFPLKTGSLHTGSLVLRFGRRGRGAKLERKTDDVVIRVTEPPLAGRPPGYAIGDVGQLALSATVEPRRIEQDGSLAVTVKVSGRGNLPQSLKVPARTGIEWLDPEKREDIDAADDEVQGYRSFGYVVRVHEAGAVDLGAVELPYWDPRAKRYSVAKAELGTVTVLPSKAQAAPAATASAAAKRPGAEEADADPFADMPPIRKTAAAYEAHAGPLVEGNALWALLAAPPFFFGIVSAGAAAGRELRRRRDEAKSSPDALAEKALREAAAAERAGDGKALAAAVERALHLAIEAATGLKSRGVLLDELPAALARRGVAPELAERAGSALGACDRVRFDPDAGAMGDLGALARDVVHELAQADLP